MSKVLRPAKFLLAGAMLVAISRCSTVSERSEFGMRAPTANTLGEPVGRDFNSIADPAERAAFMYRAAQSYAKSDRNLEACETFRTLALDMTLPEQVRQLSQVRAMPVCPPDRVLPLATTPKWLVEEATRAGLVSATRIGDPKLLALSLREVSFYEKTQKLRVARAQEALKLLDTLSETDADVAREKKVTRDRLISIAPRFALENAEMKVSPLAIANDLRNAREFDRARAIYSNVSRDKNRPDSERLRALDGIRMSYKLQLRTPEFIAASHDWQKFAFEKFFRPKAKKKDPALLKTYLDTRVQYARAIWTDHRARDAKQILSETERQINGKISLHESILIRARIAEEEKNFAETAVILNQVNVDSLPDRATKSKFLWYKGWNLRRLPTSNDTKEAIAALELAQTFEDRHSDLTRDQFWTARLYRESGNPEKARQLFADLASFSPFGFYGILAQRELKLPFSSLKTEVTKAYHPRQSSPIADHIRVPVDWFVILGEQDIGKRFVESFPLKEQWDANWSFDKKEAWLAMLSRLEQHITVGVRVDELSQDDRKRLLERRPDLLFPLPFEPRITEEAKRQSVPPALVYSIMRQESLFNTFARSPADAFGLMQLIPEMAAKAAKTLKIEFHGPEDLYDPDKNIALGTAFVKGLLKRYDGKFILSVAAYNASEKAIEGWVKSRMRSDPIEFIEEIPYDETRLYVKLVMRNFVTYQRRLSSTPVEFPEELLKLYSVSN